MTPRVPVIDRLLRDFPIAVLVMSLLTACATASAPPRRATSSAPATPKPDIRVHGKASTEAELEAQAATVDIVYLGEKHDNPEHHRLQAQVLAALLQRGSRPAVVFEMIDDDHQAVLDELAARPSVTPADYRKALAWDQGGWPSFDLYEPIFRVAIEHRLRIVGGNAPTSLVKQVAFTGEGAEHLKPLPDAAEHDLEQELADSHCGALPVEALPSMALAQRVRDARLALHAVEAPKGNGPRAVVIAGNGHARSDRGAPWNAAQIDPTLKQLSVFFEETSATPDPNPPFDAVWMTSAMPPEDHCKQFRAPHVMHESP